MKNVVLYLPSSLFAIFCWKEGDRDDGKTCRSVYTVSTSPKYHQSGDTLSRLVPQTPKMYKKLELLAIVENTLDSMTKVWQSAMQWWWLKRNSCSQWFGRFPAWRQYQPGNINTNMHFMSPREIYYFDFRRVFCRPPALSQEELLLLTDTTTTKRIQT